MGWSAPSPRQRTATQVGQVNKPVSPGYERTACWWPHVTCTRTNLARGRAAAHGKEDTDRTTADAEDTDDDGDDNEDGLEVDARLIRARAATHGRTQSRQPTSRAQGVVRLLLLDKRMQLYGTTAVLYALYNCVVTSCGLGNTVRRWSRTR